MGGRLTRLKPRGGFSAETAAMSILFTTYLKMPGSIQRLKAVRWGLATNIIWAWVMTIPASALVGAVVMFFIQLAFGKN